MSKTELGRIGFGAANLGNLYRAVSDEDAWSALEAAWGAGIRYFDTAPHYGLGLSERRVGAFLATKPRDEFVISTKVGRLLRPNPGGGDRLDDENSFAVPTNLKRVLDYSADGVRRSLDESLERLGLDFVDILFLHDPEKYDLEQADSSAYPALIDLREQGLTGAVGVGSMSVDALQRAADFAGLDLMMVAGRLTLAEQPTLAGVIPSCLRNGIGIVAAGVFNSGLLARDHPSDDSRYEYGVVPPELLERARAIAAICANHGVSLPTAALQFPLLVDPVRTVIVASARPEQVTENVERMRVPVPDALWQELTEAGLIPRV